MRVTGHYSRSWVRARNSDVLQKLIEKPPEENLVVYQAAQRVNTAGRLYRLKQLCAGGAIIGLRRLSD